MMICVDTPPSTTGSSSPCAKQVFPEEAEKLSSSVGNIGVAVSANTVVAMMNDQEEKTKIQVQVQNNCQSSYWSFLLL